MTNHKSIVAELRFAALALKNLASKPSTGEAGAALFNASADLFDRASKKIEMLEVVNVQRTSLAQSYQVEMLRLRAVAAGAFKEGWHAYPWWDSDDDVDIDRAWQESEAFRNLIRVDFLEKGQNDLLTNVEGETK